MEATGKGVITVIGGGDTATACKKYGTEDKVTWKRKLRSFMCQSWTRNQVSLISTSVHWILDGALGLHWCIF